MTKYFRNFLAIALVIEIASDRNNISAFIDVTFLCVREGTPFDFLSYLVIKYSFLPINFCNKSGITSGFTYTAIARF